jgi:aspartate aminotransferase
MRLAKVIQQKMDRTSAVRRMFETGLKLKSERGLENVCNFSLGNPDKNLPASVGICHMYM